MRLLYIFTLVFCVITTSCGKHSRNQTQSIETYNLLQIIPQKDYQLLDSFFQLLLKDYNFAYTLFGRKPISMACYSSQINLWNLYHPNDFLVFKKGWNKWKEYAFLFPSNKFALKKCYSKTGIIEIFLINKESVLNSIDENYSTFQSIIGEHFEPKQFVQKLCYSQQDIMEILNNHSGLLGILLGYGKDSSMAFERKVEICSDLNDKMTPPFTAVSAMKCLQPKSEYLVSLYSTKTLSSPEKASFSSLNEASIAKELNSILENETPFELYGSDLFLDKFISPIFMAQNDDLETIQLHEEYLATKQKLHSVYQQRPFLEVTLNQWMNPQ